MKYENLKQVKSICEQIDKHEASLESISMPHATIIINTDREYGRVFTIGTDSLCEHEYALQARQFLEYIQGDLKTRINNLKSTLELL